MLDSVFLTALLSELNLPGMRVNKISQPERDELILSLYGPMGARRLLISANPSAPRVQYTVAARENPDSAPMFCMLLRKYLSGALITAAVQPGGDRLVELHFDCTDELGYLSSRRLVVELMGRYSNVILIDPDGRIMESLKHVDAEGNPSRQILPGLFYRYPELHGKLTLESCENGLIREIIAAAPADIPADRFLLDRFAWLSPLTAREVIHLGGGALADAVIALSDRIRAGDTAPYILCESREDEGGRITRRPADFSYMPIAQYGNLREIVRAESFSSLLDEFFTERDRLRHMEQRSQAVRKAVSAMRGRLAQKLDAQRGELRSSRDREAHKKAGELLTASLHLIKKGDSMARLPDYTAEPDDNGEYPPAQIALDPRLSPQENAQAYFRRYRRAKTAEERLTALIAEGEFELEYLDSVLDAITRAASEREIDEIRQELADAGYASQRLAGKDKKGRRRKIPETKPIEYRSSVGFMILAGRNNRQNEQLTFKLAARSDIWLHAQKIPGSHVIIVCDGREPDEGTIAEAASIAAYNSAARTAGRVPVDYTMARNVRRQPGGRPGMAVYTEYRTILVEPGENAELRAEE